MCAGQVQRNAVLTVENDAVGQVVAGAGRGDGPARRDDRRLRCIEHGWIEVVDDAGLLGGPGHPGVAQAAGQREAACHPPRFFHIRRGNLVMRIGALATASLAERGGESEEIVGHGVTRGISREGKEPLGDAGRGPMAFGAEEHRESGLHLVLAVHPAPVVGHGIVQLGGARNDVIRRGAELGPPVGGRDAGHVILHVGTAVWQRLIEARNLRQQVLAADVVLAVEDADGCAGLVGHRRRQNLRQPHLEGLVVRREGIPVGGPGCTEPALGAAAVGLLFHHVLAGQAQLRGQVVIHFAQ